MVADERRSETCRRRLAATIGGAGFGSAFLARVLPHLWNLTPTGAAVAFTAARLGVGWSLVGLVVTMVASDVVLWLATYRAMGFPLFGWQTPFVYVGLAGYAGFAAWLARGRRVVGPCAALVGGSAWFFVVSNFGVWLGGAYPATPAGLVDCYVRALPFWRNMLLGDAVFGLLLFGAYEWLSRRAVAEAAGEAAALDKS